jgi:hypothetical protein
MQRTSIIFLLTCFFVCTAYSMDIINIVDNQNTVLLSLNIPTAMRTELEKFKLCAEDVGVGQSATLPPQSVQLQEIQQYVHQNSGLGIDIHDVRHALQYVAPFEDTETKQQNIKWHTITEKKSTRWHTMGATAAAIFFANNWGIKHKGVVRELSHAALETGYIDAACKHITPHSYNKNYDFHESLIALISATDPDKLTTHLTTYVARNTLITLYDAMHSSLSFHELKKEVARTEKEEQISDALYNAVETWRQAPETRLFDALHPHSMGRLFCKQVKEEYAQEGLYKKLQTHSPFKRPAVLASYKELMILETPLENPKRISWHDAYLLPKCGDFSYLRRQFPSSIFTHLPSLCLLQHLSVLSEDYAKCAYDYHSAHSSYHCDAIENICICETDKKALSALCNSPAFYKENIRGLQISFDDCDFKELPLTEQELCTFSRIELWCRRNPLSDATRQKIKTMDYHKKYQRNGGGYICREGDKMEEKYEIMPRYWPWLKLGSGLLFAGSAALFCYWTYKASQKACHDNTTRLNIHLNTRVDTIHRTILSTVSEQNIDAYRLAMHTTTMNKMNTEIRNVVHTALNTINPIPATSTTKLHVSMQDYTQAKKALQGITEGWECRNYISPGVIKFDAYANICLSMLYGLYSSSIQWVRFLYGNPPYLKNEVRGLGFIFEPLLLLETICGTNKPQSIIWIDREEQKAT